MITALKIMFIQSIAAKIKRKKHKNFIQNEIKMVLILHKYLCGTVSYLMFLQLE